MVGVPVMQERQTVKGILPEAYTYPLGGSIKLPFQRPAAADILEDTRHI